LPNPFYVTTPIYYVNDRPHIGHAYTTIAADFLTRFHVLAGREAFFLTGTDEHGSKVAEAARAAGLTEIEFCDRTVEHFKKAWESLLINYSYFIRTTSERHKKAVWKILDAMRQAKTDDGQEAVYSDYYEGRYCTGCEKFMTEKDLVDGICPLHDRKAELIKEKNYFFRLSAYLPEIKRRIKSNEFLILPEERRREVLGLIDQNIGDFSLSREKVKWGIPLSFDDSQLAYVWVDALTNYISAIGYADDQESFDKWWNGAEAVHLMAKDILKFHCLYWPAMLIAAGVKIPNTVFLHGFFTVDGEKMSKSLGKKIDPIDMVKEFGADATRYLLLTQFPFGIDGDIQVDRFTKQYNSDLANDLGNLVSRVAKLIATNFDSRLPEPKKDVSGIKALMSMAEKVPGSVYSHVKHFAPDKAIAEAMNLVKAGNKYFNDTAPWKLAKEGKTEELGGVLYACCEILRIVSIMLYPIMPNKMQELRSVLSLDDSTLSLKNAQTFFELKPGIKIELKEAIFPRLDVKKAATLKTDSKSSDNSDNNSLLDYAEFARAKLKVAVVIEAEKIEGTDKLLKLQIDLGTEKRQIVAGVAEFYSPEEIKGKKIIVVSNLKPAKIRGVESNGMLLAAKSDGKLTLVSLASDLPAGSDVS